MCNSARYIGVVLWLALVGQFAHAQPATDTVGSLPGVVIRTSVDKAEVYIGDLITYTIAIEYDTTFELIPPPLGANLGAFDVKDYRPDVESKLPDGRRRSETVFILSTFTTGDYVIPPVPVAFRDTRQQTRVLLSEVVPIKIRSMLENAGDSVDIKGLKAPYEFQRDYFWYYIAGSGLLAFLLIGLLIWLKLRGRVAVAPVDNRPPWEIAYEQLAMLQQQIPSDTAKFKTYYIELTEVMREYLGRIYAWPVLDMTTEEFLDQYRTSGESADLQTRVAGFLRHADLVKFARYEPAADRPQLDFTTAHELVGQIRQRWEQRQAAMTAPVGENEPKERLTDVRA